MFNNPYNMLYQNPGMMSGMSNMARASNLNNVGNLATRTMSGAVNASKPGFFRSLANIKWGNVLTNTQKTLNVINQAIPVYYQIKPICSNLKSFGKIMSAFSDNSDTKSNNMNNNQNNFNNNQTNNNFQTEKKEDNSNLPTFFIN